VSPSLATTPPSSSGSSRRLTATFLPEIFSSALMICDSWLASSGRAEVTSAEIRPDRASIIASTSREIASSDDSRSPSSSRYTRLRMCGAAPMRCNS